MKNLIKTTILLVFMISTISVAHADIDDHQSTGIKEIAEHYCSSVRNDYYPEVSDYAYTVKSVKESVQCNKDFIRFTRKNTDCLEAGYIEDSLMMFRDELCAIPLTDSSMEQVLFCVTDKYYINISALKYDGPLTYEAYTKDANGWTKTLTIEDGTTSDERTSTVYNFNNGVYEYEIGHVYPARGGMKWLRVLKNNKEILIDDCIY